MKYLKFNYEFFRCYKNFLMMLIISLLELLKINFNYERFFVPSRYWYVELSDDIGIESYVTRELGFDCNGKVIFSAPTNDNYGYFVDNNLGYNDFLSSFDCIEITKEEFEKYWNLQ